MYTPVSLFMSYSNGIIESFMLANIAKYNSLCLQILQNTTNFLQKFIYPSLLANFMITEKQRFGRGLIREISKYVYKNPIVVYREGVSNGLDAMDPYREQEDPRIEIYTNHLPDADIVIEDWGTGIENYEEFLTIAEGEKRVRGEVSSYEKVSDRIIGQKGMGKMSFLSMSSVNRVEFFSNNEKLGLHIILTDDPNDVKIEPMNSQLALPHHGLKVVIKRARR